MGSIDGPGPALPDTNHAPTFLIVVGVFIALVTCLCACRIYSRIRPKVNLHVDDYLILIATVSLSTITSILAQLNSSIDNVRRKLLHRHCQFYTDGAIGPPMFLPRIN